MRKIIGWILVSPCALVLLYMIACLCQGVFLSYGVFAFIPILIILSALVGLILLDN